MTPADASQDLIEQVRAAAESRTALRIVGGNTKAFYGRRVAGTPLSTLAHCGIVNHDPAELVVTVRSGTQLDDLESTLAEHGQCLPFEPPHFGTGATVGGMIACGLAGPARASTGTVRDYVLGARLLTGDARVLRFGGEVIKNVAGYDVSRLLAGSLGILGVLLEISIKVLPRRPASATQVFELDATAALTRVAELAAKPLPLTASCWVEGCLYLRFDASEPALARVLRELGGEALREPGAFWAGIREQTHAFFSGATRLHRIHARGDRPSSAARESALYEWHGMQRWCRDLAAESLSRLRSEPGTQLTLFRGGQPDQDVFAPLPPPVMQLHRALKQAFDPAGILNPGRMYAEL